MHIRAFASPDLEAVMGLYRQMLAEYADDPRRAHYPVVDDRTPDEMHTQILQGLWRGGKSWYGVVAEQDATILGTAFGEVYTRPVGKPKTVGHVYLLYVHPDHRGGAGRRSVAFRLLRALSDLVMPDHPGLVLEASATVGSRTERVWQGLGFRPYQTFMAWAHPDGTPRQAEEFFTRRHHGRC
jgi:GNAT superfamily N-acetyltransferase